MCEQCREQDQNPNGIFLHAKTEDHASLAGSLSVLWDTLTPRDLQKLNSALYGTDANIIYFKEQWRKQLRDEYKNEFKTIIEYLKEN